MKITDCKFVEIAKHFIAHCQGIADLAYVENQVGFVLLLTMSSMNSFVIIFILSPYKPVDHLFICPNN